VTEGAFLGFQLGDPVRVVGPYRNVAGVSQEYLYLSEREWQALLEGTWVVVGLTHLFSSNTPLPAVALARLKGSSVRWWVRPHHLVPYRGEEGWVFDSNA
jgi:hypothetical protein